MPSQPSIPHPPSQTLPALEFTLNIPEGSKGENARELGDGVLEPRAGEDKELIFPSVSHSTGERTYCRICQEDDTHEKLYSPCMCAGSVGFVHISCLEKWLRTNGRTQCELCSFSFPVEKVMPSIWQYMRHPTQNMDFSSLISDTSCFLLLTPLLFASTYFCLVGASRYYDSGKYEAAFAVIMLMVSLLTIYGAWLTLAVMYHRRVWLKWRDRSVQIRMAAIKPEDQMHGKWSSEAESDEDTLASESYGAASRQESISVLLKPVVMLAKTAIPSTRKAVSKLGILSSIKPSDS